MLLTGLWAGLSAIAVMCSGDRRISIRLELELPNEVEPSVFSQATPNALLLCRRFRLGIVYCVFDVFRVDHCHE